MINLYCNFDGNKRKIYRKLKKQDPLSHIFSTKEFILGEDTSLSQDLDLIKQLARTLNYDFKISSNSIINCDFFILDLPRLYEKILSRQATIYSSRYLLVKAKSLPSFFPKLVNDLANLGIVIVFLHSLKNRIQIEDFPLGLLHMLDAKDLLSHTKRNAALSLIERGHISFVAGTDIIKGRNIVEKHLGPDIAERIFIKNPNKLLQDKSIY